MVMRLPLAIAGCVALLLPVAEAEARSCAGPPGVLAPAWGSRDVPTNTRFWIAPLAAWESDASLDGLEMVLIGSDGMEVELVAARIGLYGRELSVLTPAQELLPSSSYQLWACDGPVCSTQLTEITTGTGPDAESPPLPAERERDHGVKVVSLLVDFEGILLVDLGGGQLDPATLTGSVHDVTAAHDEPVFLGRGGCVDSWPGSIRDDRPLRYGALDLAGNFSGWTEPETLAVDGCACSTERRGGSPRGVLVLLALLAGARARRR